MNEHEILPIIQGRVGQTEEGQWFGEIIVRDRTTLEIINQGQQEFGSQSEAESQTQAMLRSLGETCDRAVGLEPSGQYTDLLAEGAVRRFDELPN